MNRGETMTNAGLMKRGHKLEDANILMGTPMRVIKLFKNHKLESELSDRFKRGVAKVNPTFHTKEFKEWHHRMIVSATNSKVAYTKGPSPLSWEWNPNGIEEMRAIFQF